MEKVAGLTDFKNQKKGIITPKALTENLLRAIENGEVEELIYVAKGTDGIIRVGWAESTHLKLLGLLEVGKTYVIHEMDA